MMPPTVLVPLKPEAAIGRTKFRESEGMTGTTAERNPTETPGTNVDAVEESVEARVERLGRQRPAQFSSLWTEIGFCYSIVASQIMAEYFVSGFNVIVPTLMTKLDIPSASVTWPASAFSLVASAFLLPFGRLADMYGGYPLYMGGLVWLFAWSIIAGFSQNSLMLIFCRALQGLGPAAFLPSGMMLLGSMYRPGPRKNLVFSIYGACAPVGFFVGIFFSGLAGEYLHWGWYFWIGAALVLTIAPVAYYAVPSDISQRRKFSISMDWLGALCLVPGLVLVVYSITDGAHAPDGWKTPYIYVTLILGVGFLAAMVYIEGWVASTPLLPFDFFRIPYMKSLIIALLFSYGTLGVYLLYATLYIQTIMGATPLQVTAWFVPMALGGCIISTIGGLILHVVQGTLLMILAGVGWVLASLLFAIAPPHASYWAYIFPAMICATIGIDITFNIANIFITTNLPLKQQGLAGAVINSTLYLGISLLLGFADVVAVETEDLGERKSYQAVFKFALACAVVALLIMVLFVKIVRAKSDLTEDERRQMQEASNQPSAS